MENSIFGSSEILQCLPCVHTYIRPSAINGQNNILTKILPTEHEYITMNGLLVTLKNLFVRTEHDYITCMTWQFPVKNRLQDNMSITMHGTSIFSNPVYISLYFPPIPTGTYQCCFLHYPTHTLNNADLTLTMPVLFDMMQCPYSYCPL